MINNSESDSEELSFLIASTCKNNGSLKASEFCQEEMTKKKSKGKSQTLKMKIVFWQVQEMCIYSIYKYLWVVNDRCKISQIKMKLM